VTELQGLPAGSAEYLEEIKRDVVTSQQSASAHRMLNSSLARPPSEESRGLPPADAGAAARAIARPDTDEDDETADDE
jgi:hypothetical protein